MFEWTEDQKAAITGAVDGFRSGIRRISVDGQAGSGKTTAAREIVRQLGVPCFASAPTHKAVAIQEQSFVGAEGVLPEFGTVHSALGLSVVYGDGGTGLRKSGRGRLDGMQLLIVDEASMVGASLQQHLDQHPIAQLYIGDTGQLPPVENNPAAETADDTDQIARCLTDPQTPRFTLREIVRQEAGNPIRQVTQRLRQQQEGPAREIDTRDLDPWNLQPYRLGDHGVFATDPVQLEELARHFDIAANPDAMRVCCFTNASTFQHSGALRRALLGETSTPFVVGETVMTRSPIGQLGAHGQLEIEVPVNIELRVREICQDRRTIILGGPPLGWHGVGYPEHPLGLNVWVVTLEDPRTGGLVCCDIARAPNGSISFSWARRQARIQECRDADRRDDARRLEAALVDLRPVYALTTHSAQGSTFDITVLDFHDLMRSGKISRLTRLRLLYTAATRPRHALLVLGRTHAANRMRSPWD